MNITVGHTTFDRVRYDSDADTLYLHVGEPDDAADFDESPEGHTLRFNADGEWIGVTIVNAKRLLDGGNRSSSPSPNGSSSILPRSRRPSPESGTRGKSRTSS